jgi:serine/threonine protein phosphatase PrpC
MPPSPTSHSPILVAGDKLRFGPRLDVAAASSAGAEPGPGVQLENQDNFLLIDAHGRAVFMHGQALQQMDVAGWTAGHVRLAVLDGMGGHGHGRQAAEAVVAGLLAIPPCLALPELAARLDTLHERLQREFADADAEADADAKAAGKQSARRPGTTLTLLEIPPGQPPLLYHVGDSRLYEITVDRVFPLTVDHVPATAFAMAGVLGEQEWWQQVHGEHRSQIAQAFILGNAFANPAMLSDPLFELSASTLPPFLRHLPDRRTLTLRPDAVYVLATDGFWACFDPHLRVGRWPALLSRARNALGVVELLFEEISSKPPPDLHIDNLTAIVLRPLADLPTAADPGDETYA